MITLQVPFFEGAGINTPATELDALLLSNKPQFITHEPWPLPGAKPRVCFYIAYGVGDIFLKFNVKEACFKAFYTHINDLVYKDSCVEFFIATGDGDNYYNFEFNAIGTGYAAYGSADQRELLDPGLVEGIKVTAWHKTNDSDDLPFEWEITLTIPFNTFFNRPAKLLKGSVCPANFYKCGDDLPYPHYLCWNNIDSASPNFHLPQCFGRLIFG
jgi:hypothetical protein